MKKRQRRAAAARSGWSSDHPPPGREWHPCDARAFHGALAGYRVAGVFHGHTHARAIQRWNGSALDAADGVPVSNVDNASHFGGRQQAFFLVTIDGPSVTIRECATSDAWETHAWSPQTWSGAVATV